MKITLTNGIVRNVGSISWGTLRNEDIIPAFLDECESCKLDATKQRQEWVDYCEVLEVTEDVLYAVLDTCEYKCHRSYDSIESRNALESVIAKNSEMIAWLSDELFEMLNDIAPDYAYFGNTDGDGADFGWWYESITEDSEGNTIVNPDDISFYGYESRYNVSFDAMGSTFVAFADNESDALDYVLDFCEENEYNGYLLNADEESEALADRVSVGYGGNHGVAYNGDNLTIRKAA